MILVSIKLTQFFAMLHSIQEATQSDLWELTRGIGKSAVQGIKKVNVSLCKYWHRLDFAIS